jgi:hypothetical protein
MPCEAAKAAVLCFEERVFLPCTQIRTVSNGICNKNFGEALDAEEKRKGFRRGTNGK